MDTLDSFFVVKVQYGEMLRRFRTTANGFRDLSKFKYKISDLFNLTSKFTLTYVDEDGDIVTLVDDDDFFEMMNQTSLRPLRITVTKSQETADVVASKFGSLPANSPLKFLPGYYEKYEDKVASNSRDTEDFASPGIATRRTANPSDINNHADPVASSPRIFSSTSSRLIKRLSTSPRKAPIHPNTWCDMCQASPIVGARYKSRIIDNYDLCESCLDKWGNEAEYVRIDEDGEIVTLVDDDDIFEMMNQTSVKPLRITTVAQSQETADAVASKFGSLPANSPLKFFLDCYEKFGGNVASNSRDGKDFASPGKATRRTANPSDINNDAYPVASCPGKSSSTGSRLKKRLPTSHRKAPIHPNTWCDMCEVSPIVGARYKSRIIDNYDLCETCLEKWGNEAEYVRIDEQFSHHV